MRDLGQYNNIGHSCCTLVYPLFLEKMAVFYCCVFDCKSNSTCSKINFYKIPVNYSDEWLAACGRNADWRPKPSSKICSLHFSPHQIVHGRLARDAVPFAGKRDDSTTLLLGQYLIE